MNLAPGIRFCHLDLVNITDLKLAGACTWGWDFELLMLWVN